jgi:hypothetical protein
MKSQQKGRERESLKNINFNLASPVEYCKISLDRAYQFIEAGSPVEIRTRLQGQMLAKEDRIKPGDPEVWPWIHKYFPHLRPDFILKSMPEGTVFLINPVSDGRIVQWVMSKSAQETAPVDLTKRLLRVKESVKQSTQKGKQSMLPKVLRKQLSESGQKDYSVNTAMPRLQARAKFSEGGKVTYGSEEKKWKERDAETDKFMVPDPQVERKRFNMAKGGRLDTSNHAKSWQHQRGGIRTKGD